MTLALGHKSVKDMLRHVSSREINEWMAYERYEGPIGPIYERAALRQIASLLNNDEKAKSFPTPTEIMGVKAPVQEEENDWAAMDAIIPEG